MGAVTGNITIRQMTDAIKKTLSGIASIKQLQDSETIAETIAETPLVQIYFGRREILMGSTDRVTFSGRRDNSVPPIRPKRTTIIIDAYGRQRSQIGQDIAAIQDLADEIEDALDQQNHKPYFGLSQLEAFKFYSERVIFEYGNTKYSGVRFTLELVTM